MLLSATPTEVVTSQVVAPAAITVPAGSLPSLDIDLNGQADALSDGIVIIRHLFGFTGNALTDGAVDPAGQRTDPTSIEAFLNGFLPVSSPSVQQQSIVASAPVTSPATTTTTTSSNATASSVSLGEMEWDTTTQSSATLTESNYSLAYVQRSWVKDSVATTADVTADDEELLIQLA